MYYYVKWCFPVILCCLVLLNMLKADEWSRGTGWAKFDVPERRAMWVWSMGDDGAGANKGTQKWDGVDHWVRGFQNYKGSRDLFFDFCENKSIRVIYLWNGTWEWDQETFNKGMIPHEEDFAEVMKEAEKRGIQVWLMGYLWDATNAKEMMEDKHKQSIKKIMIAIKNFNNKYPDTPIAGYHNDEEPQRAVLYPHMLDTLKIAQDWVDENAPELMISQAIASFWRGRKFEWNGSSKTMNNHIIDLIGHTAYMAYSDDPGRVLNAYAKPAVQQAASAGHKAAIGLETENIAWFLNPNTTWWEEIQAEPEATRFKTDKADPATFEDCMHTTADALRNQKGYDRMVIHQYSAYFTHWFGMRPREYCLSRLGGAYDPKKEKPGKVNLLIDKCPLAGIGPKLKDNTTETKGK